MPQFKSYPLVRTSGTCIACDYQVRDEMVLLISPPSGLRTRAFVLELRHLDEEPYAALRPNADPGTGEDCTRLRHDASGGSATRLSPTSPSD